VLYGRSTPPHGTPQRAFPTALLALILAACLLPALSAGAQSTGSPQVSAAPIVIKADQAARWSDGAAEIWLLRGHCEVKQGLRHVRGDEAVVWIDLDDGGRCLGTLTAYFEGNVALDGASRAGVSGIRQAGWLDRFTSTQPPRVECGPPQPEPQGKPAVFHSAAARRDALRHGDVRRTQFEEVAPDNGAPPPGTRRIFGEARGDVGIQAQVFPSPDGSESIATIDSGIHLIIEGVEVEGFDASMGVIDILADRMVIWTSPLDQLDFGGQSLQDSNQPLELYMEGNLVFRQGDRVIYADRMYYNVPQRTGMILDAELLTPAPQYSGLVRLRAEQIEQIGEGRFLAHDAWITSSRMGQPTYRMESSEIYYEDHEVPAVDPETGLPLVDPMTGEMVIEHERLASSFNNVLRIGELPVFYWPAIVTDLEDPTFYLRRIQVRSDDIFGTQVLTDWDTYEVLGIPRIRGTDWEFSVDYLSERGPAGGTRFKYNRNDTLFGVPSSYGGFVDAWAIYDTGRDVLGGGRNGIVPEEEFRYRVLGRHRQQLPGDIRFTAELGLISDRNFLEQYYENEWDEFKDQTTGIELKKIYDNQSLNLWADARVNDFFTQTEWLPRVDHFWLGESLFGDSFTWFEHSQASYARLRTASTPEDPTDAATFDLLPWEENASGERLITRQELDYPFELGPFKVVPYLLGELGHWGEVLDGQDTQRAFGQAGVRASIPFWASNPDVESGLFNVHGIAHKVVFDAEYFFADSNRDLDEFPLYDPLDDDNIEDFRRRFSFNTFGAPPIPLRFDERFYALRTGLQSQVTSPATEIADDLQELRLGVRQRWQTKRGMPGERRIIDWIVLDTQATIFPDSGRDNFGEALGLAEYDFRWHVGDRVTLLSSGGFDFFDDGQELMSVGVILNRPPKGSIYLGFHSLQGPIDAEVLTASFSYRLSPKWLASASTSIDFGTQEATIGQSLSLTRIGEAFLVSFNFFNDANKDNVGMSLAIEPRFLPMVQLGRGPGAQIPLAGLYGLE